VTASSTILGFALAPRRKRSPARKSKALHLFVVQRIRGGGVERRGRVENHLQIDNVVLAPVPILNTRWSSAPALTMSRCVLPSERSSLTDAPAHGERVRGAAADSTVSVPPPALKAMMLEPRRCRSYRRRHRRQENRCRRAREAVVASTAERTLFPHSAFRASLPAPPEAPAEHLGLGAEFGGTENGLRALQTEPCKAGQPSVVIRKIPPTAVGRRCSGWFWRAHSRAHQVVSFGFTRAAASNAFTRPWKSKLWNLRIEQWVARPDRIRHCFRNHLQPRDAAIIGRSRVPAVEGDLLRYPSLGVDAYLEDKGGAGLLEDEILVADAAASERVLSAPWRGYCSWPRHG